MSDGGGFENLGAAHWWRVPGNDDPLDCPEDCPCRKLPRARPIQDLEPSAQYL